MISDGAKITPVTVVSVGTVAAPTVGTFPVTVPAGVAPGETMTASAPDGRQVHVLVPPGSIAGSTIDVPLPPAQQQPAAAGATVQGWVADAATALDVTDDGSVSIDLPPGPVGVVLMNGSTIVHSLQPTSPLVGQLNPGDKIIAIQQPNTQASVDTGHMNDEELGHLLAACSDQPGRRITFVRRAPAARTLPAQDRAAPDRAAVTPTCCAAPDDRAAQERQCNTITASIFLAVQAVGTLFWMVIWIDALLLHLVHFFCVIVYGGILAFYRSVTDPRTGDTVNDGCWKGILITFGIIFVLVCLCCCFDADSTVWRLNLDGHTMEEVALRELSLGDSVLSLNPVTRETHWEKVMAKVHYSAFDGGRHLSSMRTLVLASNASITLSHTHFIYAHADDDAAAQELVRARDVRIGDRLLHHDVSTGETAAVPVVSIESQVMRQKRSFFLTSPYVLVNNISASPYMGAHPAIAPLQHACYATTVRNAPHPRFTQAWVTATSIPFLVLNNFAQFVMQAISM